MSKKAFTLIEVLISVSIISIIVAAFLNIEQESKFLIDKNVKKIAATHLSSIVLLNTDQKDDKSDLYLYDLLKGFDLKDDLIKFLKSKKVHISFDLYKTIGDDENSSEENKSVMLNIYKQTANIDGNVVSIYRISLP